MRCISLTPNRNRGPGWVNLEISSLGGNLGLIDVIIERPNHEKEYLGEAGWQVAESRFNVECVTSPSGEAIVILSPAIVQFMELGNNYKISIYGRGIEALGIFVLTWRGIPGFRPKSGIAAVVNPIEPISSVVGVTPEPSVFGGPGSLVGTGPQNEPVTSYERHFPTEVVPQAGAISPTADTTELVEVFPRGGIDVSLHESPPNPPLTSKSTRIKTRIVCRNPECKSEILDTMLVCPFCGTQV
jgi:hypothetical protein